MTMVLVLLVNVKPVESQLPVTVKVPVPVRVPVSIVLVASMLVPVVEIVPLMVRLLKLLLELRKFSVLVVPLMTIVLVPFVNVAVALLLSQFPLTVDVPDPRVTMPLDPIVVSTAVNVLLFVL